MKKRIRCLYCVIIGIFISVVVYYGNDSKENGGIVAFLRRCQALIGQMPLLISERTDTVPTPCVTGRPCMYRDPVDLRVIVITFNRPGSLLKLLRSLDTLVLDGDRAALEIWIDRSRKNVVDGRTLEVASEFKWKGGQTRIHVQVLFLYALETGEYLVV